MDKSPHNTSTKKAGKSLKEKRVEKKAKVAGRGAADAVADSVSHGKRAR